ncbi:probable F-box protein At4g22030 [Arachis stenosperma]|uniref:probable F-box protein At4g22030 n=1 Tax=Arachis stenosperma TaxID=217475 RepID=UPI0025AD712A|nr:probable F-box protein At4g22030 [Arachis stenosperma]
MATCVIHSRVSSFWCLSTRSIAATMNVPKIHVTKITTTPSSLAADLDYLNNFTSSTTTTTTKHYTNNNNYSNNSTTLIQKSMEIAKLHLIMEIVSDRLEMHKNVAAQRDNWNHLLLTSVNMITLSASTMLALAATSTTSSGAPLMALKVSSTILFMAATGILAVMNKFQPSQLAEEQRNAARLFKQLNGELRTKVSLGNANEFEVTEAMERVLALDKAYPLPLLGTMLDKFPHKIEPAVWWPQKKKKHHWKEEVGDNKNNSNNGWDSRLEGEMKAIVKAVRKKDMAEYTRLSRKALNLNKVLAVSGPLLTGLAAIGSACLGCVNGSWPVMFGVVGGALACVVNTVEHGGQVGMVFELYRSLIGFFKLMEESIQQNLREKDLHRRENGELFEIKVALQLGKSLEELRQFSSSTQNDFASKLF